MWARVVATYTQSVYVGVKPSDDVTHASSALFVLRRGLAAAASEYPYSLEYPTAVPATGVVTCALVDNGDLPAYKRTVADVIVKAKRHAKAIKEGKPSLEDDRDDDIASISAYSVKSGHSSTVVKLKTKSHVVKGARRV